MADSPLVNNARDNTGYAVDKIINYNQTGEGGGLPPVRRGQYRVPLPSGFQVISVATSGANRIFTLAWSEVSIPATLRIDRYNIYFTVTSGNKSQPIGLAITAGHSPAVITLPGSGTSLVTFSLQVVLKNGMASEISAGPTVSSIL